MEKFTEGAKTLRVIIYFLIVVVIVGGAYLIINSSGSGETKVSFNIENLRLVKCQELVVAKGTCNVKAEISQPLHVAGFDMPSFAPGSKSVSYNDKVTIRFGYDSTMPLFPKGTEFVSHDDHYEITVSEFPYPKVLNDATIKGYTDESKSFFTGSIPKDTFYHFLDSLANVGGMRTIKGNPDYFRDAYATMAFSLIKSLLAGKNFTLTVGGKPYHEDFGLKDLNTEQNFVEDVEGSKRL